MTWTRNVFVIATAFMLGRISVRDGWQRFAVTQLALVLIAALVIIVWLLVETVERKVKGKRPKPPPLTQVWGKNLAAGDLVTIDGKPFRLSDPQRAT